MTHLKFSLKNLVSIFMVAIISFLSAMVIFAQCEGTYFKPTVRTITDSQVYVYELQERFAGDLNGDGKLDLVATNINSPVNYNKLFIYPGNGAGGFGARTEINLPGVLYRAGSYYLEDFNRDNKTDLIVHYSSNVLVYLNNGAGVFTPLTATALSIDEKVENLVDLNNDMRKDLITSIGATYYRLANADGTFGARVQLPPMVSLGRHEGDFDGDGDMDFASIDYSGATNALTIIVNQGNGTFTLSNPLIFLDSGTFYVKAVTDFNNDGRPDVLLNADFPSRLTVVLNQGNNSFTKTTYNMTFFVNTFLVQLGDFNGDGFTDFINYFAESGNLTSGYFINLNNGAGAFTQRFYPFGLFLYDRPVGDLNGDGKTDFIRINNAVPSGGNFSSNIFYETQFTVKTSVCSNFGQPKIVDFTGDGKTEMTHWRSTDGRWRYVNSTLQRVSSAFYWGAPEDLPVPGDYDGDRLTDYAVFRPSNGVWYVSNSSNNSLTAVQFGTGTDKPVPADYDGDGRTDFAVYRPSNGTWYFLTSGTNQFSARQFGIAEDIPVPEDYDGDERADIAVFRPSQGSWYILRSSNNSFYGVQWGLSTDEPHPSDFDGDGKADISVRRRSNNYWYILRSYNNQSGAIQFGISEDIAQTGDWDGNGIMDIGVYRPSTRSWFSTGLVFLGTFGEAGEMPVASISK
ncbi:MAG: VCBS repeat-containing protein [Acidobacteriota bacterium]|nr:VCBS repeat-containing protein [Acidobacteriota bacterium]